MDADEGAPGPPAPLWALPLRGGVRPPRRELGVADTLEALRRLRRDGGIFAELCPHELQALAELCSPLGFQRSEPLFARGEPATWFGVLLSGRAKAVVPREDGPELVLGEHGEGSLVGATRAGRFKQSHVRAYTLRGLEAGYVAVVSYDQLEVLQNERPALRLALQRALLGWLADAACSFFRGCPLSSGVKWPIVAFHERRVLDMLLDLRKRGMLFADVDYRALLVLACRIRVTHWRASDRVLSRGEPMSAALVVLDGKLTGFEDEADSPSVWFEPGSCVGLESALGSVRPCSVDVFAARPTHAALLWRSDLEELAREYPGLASQLVESLYGALLRSLAGERGAPLLLMAEGAGTACFLPGDVPLLQRRPLRLPGGLDAGEAQELLEAAHSTRLASAPAAARVGLGVAAEASRDDAALLQLLGTAPDGAAGPRPRSVPPGADDWLLGAFLRGKRLRRIAAPAAAPRRTTSPGRLAPRQARAASTPPATLRRRPLLAYPVSHPDRLNVTGTEVDPRGSAGQVTETLTQALASARSAGRSEELRHRRPAWAQRAPAPRRARSASPRVVGLESRGGGSGVTDLTWRGSRAAPPPESTSCGSAELSREAPFKGRLSGEFYGAAATGRGTAGPTPSGGDEAVLLRHSGILARKVARVVSAGLNHGNAADFYLDGRKIPLGGGAASNRRGLNVLIVDPVSHGVLSALCYDTAASGRSASARLAADLGAVPDGHVVLAAVCGSGLDGLSAAALRALQHAGATAACAGGGRPHEAYALIGVQGGHAVAERRGFLADAEGRLPLHVEPPGPRPPATTALGQSPGDFAGEHGPDLRWALEQQRQFLSELRRTAACPEESVAADQYQVWSAQLAAQQAEVERLRARTQELEQALADAQTSAAVLARERDEWRARAQRHEMNREFRSVVDSTGGGRLQTADEQEWQRRLRASEAPSWFTLEEAPRREGPQQPTLLRPTCRDSAPDFGRALRQQLGLVEGQRQAKGD